jgi:hypothetical protein
MMGIEMMLSNMLGVKPEQMRTMFEGMAEAAGSGVETMKRIETKLDRLLSLAEGTQNEAPGHPLSLLDNSSRDATAQE